MNRLGRYWKLWRTLPDQERRMRARRVLDRALRRNPRVRKLGLMPNEPTWRAFRRALRISAQEFPDMLRADSSTRGPLFSGLRSRADAVAEAHPEHADTILARAAMLLDSRFDLLGSGPSRPLTETGEVDWHLDWKSGLRWPRDVYHLDVRTVRGDGSDVKLPWELSRFQHLNVLGQAWWLAPRRLPRDAAQPLRQRCALALRRQVDDWMLSNPCGIGVNWACTMDVAIRAVNWLAGVALMREAPELDDAFLRRWCRSLWSHGQHIRANLEIGSDGLTSNHYLANVIGLYALGCALPELNDAEDWRRFGRNALEDEVQRQVGPDGVDFERSIPYHRLVTEMFLHAALLGQSTGEPFPTEFLNRLSLMLEFIATYTRPDGSAPQWGDNDDGRFLPLDGYAASNPHDHRHLLATGGMLLGRSDLLQAAEGRDVEALWLHDLQERSPAVAPAGTTSRGFADAGYYVMRDDELHCGVSCGPVGTGGLGNHTHNDLLSVCVWADGVEWITDPGSGSYTGDPELRNRLRSTAVHATLQLETREQNPFGSGLDDLFVLREHADPQVERWNTDGQTAELVAVHSGFSTPGERWTHRRGVRFEPADRRWRIEDRLLAEARAGNSPLGANPVYLRFPLRPEITCERIAERAAWPAELVRLVESPTQGGGVRTPALIRLWRSDKLCFWIVLDLPTDSRVEIRESLYSPRYGVTERTQVVTAVMRSARELCARTILQARTPMVPCRGNGV